MSNINNYFALNLYSVHSMEYPHFAKVYVIIYDFIVTQLILSINFKLFYYVSYNKI